MKLVVFPAQTKSLTWKIANEPFPRLEVSLVFGRNKKDRTFIPLVGDVPENILSTITSVEHYECFKNSKGTYLIKRSQTPSKGFLFLVTVEGGFRGSVSLVINEGELITKAHASAACESALALAVILKAGERIIVKTTGRYGTLYHVFRGNGDDTVISMKLSPDEYEYLEDSMIKR